MGLSDQKRIEDQLMANVGCGNRCLEVLNGHFRNGMFYVR